jgi:acylphosphatase
MIARRAVVSGSVQGVGFRFFAERAAREAGVTGWVRNRPDGTVETVVEGEPGAVARYLERMRTGPAGCRVTRFHEEESAVTGLNSFEITR